MKAEGPEVIPASESDQESNLCGVHLAFPSHPQSQHRRPSPPGIPSDLHPFATPRPCCLAMQSTGIGARCRVYFAARAGADPKAPFEAL